MPKRSWPFPRAKLRARFSQGQIKVEMRGKRLFLPWKLDGRVPPPPQQLAEYEKVHPGLAECIIQMAERQQNHRHQKDMAPDKWRARGQWLGFTIVIVALGIVAYLVANGSPIQGGVPVFIALSGLVSSAVWSSVMGRRERKENLPSRHLLCLNCQNNLSEGIPLSSASHAKTKDSRAERRHQTDPVFATASTLAQRI